MTHYKHWTSFVNTSLQLYSRTSCSLIHGQALLYSDLHWKSKSNLGYKITLITWTEGTKHLTCFLSWQSKTKFGVNLFFSAYFSNSTNPDNTCIRLITVFLFNMIYAYMTVLLDHLEETDEISKHFCKTRSLWTTESIFGSSYRFKL